jgi:hypothetical protein
MLSPKYGRHLTQTRYAMHFATPARSHGKYIINNRNGRHRKTKQPPAVFPELESVGIYTAGNL